MKISRIVMSLIYIISLCFCICACSDNDLSNKTPQGENVTPTKEIGIYDTNDNFITAIDTYVLFVQIEDGFIYAKSLTNSTGKNR